MKKLGIIGGMGPESTLTYYHDICYLYKEQTGKQTFPNIIIESIDIFEMLGYCNNNEYEKLFDYLYNALQNIESANADFAIMSANTPHIVFDKLAEKSKIPLISIIDATLEKVKESNVNKIGLLGTNFTMTEAFYRLPFEQVDIKVVTPCDDDKAIINEKIDNELEIGIINRSTKEYFLSVIEDMIEKQNIEGLVLGCTELPMIIKKNNIPIKYFDTTKNHIEKVVEYMIKG